MKAILEEILANNIDKIILSNPKNKDIEYKKIVVRKIRLKDELVYQFEKFTQTQAFHENVTEEDCLHKLEEYLQDQFKQCDAYTEVKTYVIKISKKGKVMVSSKVLSQTKNVNIEAHNKKKRYLLEEGTCIPPLIDLNVFTKEGKVVQSMYDKYKQINRFIEMIDDCITPDMKQLNIIDFGCGKSYLTFILYYYLVEVKQLKVNMVGLDLKKDVIKKCNDIADKYGYENLKFEVGNIDGYQTTFDVDMVITLHACDTATDHALYNAIKWNAKMIFSVPCCQHEVNAQIQSDEFSIMTKYGLLKERMSAILTDEIRANLLESQSYKVQVLEFIDIAHSPKNILLRCIKSDKISEKKKYKAKKEVEILLDKFNFKHTLYELMKEM